MNWSPVETGRENLVKLKSMVFNSPKIMSDRIKLNYTRNNKVDTISEIWFPPKKWEHISIYLS